MKPSLLFIFCLCLTSQTMYAQDILNRKVDYNVINVTLEEALDELSNSIKTNIAYNSDLVAEGKSVSLSVRSATVSSILDKILQGRSLRYEIIGRQIVLFKITPSPRKYTISGFITDATTSEKLILANIFEPKIKQGSVSNNYGFYSITLPQGPVSLQFSYLGYKTTSRSLDLQGDTRLDITLETALTLQEIVITAPEINPSYLRPAASTNLINPLFRNLPTTGGEDDLLRYVQILPGVQSGADGIGGINVRGGSADQNLILLDDVPVYNPTHLAGVFSVFNTSAIQSASIYKSSIPARYGNRLSSVIDVRTKEGNKKTFSGELSLGALAAKMSLEGPIKRDQTSFFISGRASLLGFYIRPISKQTKEERGSTGQSNYNFNDFNARIHHIISEKDELSVSFYRGRDRYDNVSRDRLIRPDTIFDDTLTQQLVWGNTLASFRWNHLFGDRLFASTTLYFSTYDFDSEDLQSASLRFLIDDFKLNFVSLTRFQSRISSLGAKISFDYAHNAKHYMRFGAAYNLHFFSPGAAQIDRQNTASIGELIAQINLLGEQDNPNIKVPSLDAFWEDEILIGNKLRIEPGIHLSAWLVEDRPYFNLQPRILVNYQWTDQWTSWAAYGRHFQPIHLLSASSINLPNDLWVPSTERERPQESTQYSMGSRLLFNEKVSIELEGFYKKMYHLTSYLEGGTLGFTNTEEYQNNITTGSGESYGLEVVLAYSFLRSNLNIAYTWSRSERQFAEVNFGEPYLFEYDRRHNLNIAWSTRMGEKWRFSAQGVFASGTPTTLPTGTYPSIGSGFQSTFVRIFPPRNSFQLPHYQRVDVGLSYRKKKDVFEHIFNFGVNNVLGRQNPVFYRLRTFVNNPTYVQTTLIPFLPYFSYVLKF